ncbi:hypothetical protein [Halodesulfovibrio sp.]|jgi:hypothetical protein|uniref:hypothetical protein n=1 Tax=Halodesulfovibrio sp. TaxID=1912772 RepID=UPI0025D2774C|nr:hypothetical protein [Halodesulfovibrio sp.]MCT4627380.1 hypothetical protein [Halodesulfovibrio sp.]
MKTLTYKLSLVLLLFSILTGCGGTKEISQETTTSIKQPTTISGAVVAAPINNATVEAYCNDTWIPVGVTENGYISFTKLDKITTFPVLLRANANGQGVNARTGSTFKAELRGIMMSREEKVYLTPVTTLGAFFFEAGGSTTKAAESAKAKIKNLVQYTLGFADVDPYANPLGDALFKHEVVQQAFMVTLGIKEETDHTSMEQFTTVIANVAENMKHDTFLGAAKKVNTKLGSTVREYIKQQQGTIVRRAAALLYDHTRDPIDQEKEQEELADSMSAIIETLLLDEESSESFICEKITDKSDIGIPLQPAMYSPKKANPTPLRFRVVLLSNKNSVTELTNNGTKKLVSPFNGGFTITEVPAVGILNAGQPLAVLEEQKISADSTEYTNDSEFSFFFDFASAPIDSQHHITFAAVDNPTITYTITFIVKGEGEVIIESVSSTGSSKLFAFDEGDTKTIPQGAVASLTDGQIAARLTPAFGSLTPEKVFDAVMVQFTAPEGFIFRGEEHPSKDIFMSILPSAANNTFTFALPSLIDIVATHSTAVGKKNIEIKVLDKKSREVLAQTKSEVFFVPQSKLGCIVEATISNQSKDTFYFAKSNANDDNTLDSFTFNCELKTWYDLAEIPKEKQPEDALSAFPNTWKLRFDNAPTGQSGFKENDGSYSAEVNLQPYLTSGVNNPAKFEIMDYREQGGRDHRLTIKPYTFSNTIRLYYKMDAESSEEHMVDGTFIVKQEP